MNIAYKNGSSIQIDKICNDTIVDRGWSFPSSDLWSAIGLTLYAFLVTKCLLRTITKRTHFAE